MTSLPAWLTRARGWCPPHFWVSPGWRPSVLPLFPWIIPPEMGAGDRGPWFCAQASQPSEEIFQFCRVPVHSPDASVWVGEEPLPGARNPCSVMTSSELGLSKDSVIYLFFLKEERGRERDAVQQTGRDQEGERNK